MYFMFGNAWRLDYGSIVSLRLRYLREDRRLNFKGKTDIFVLERSKRSIFELFYKNLSVIWSSIGLLEICTSVNYGQLSSSFGNLLKELELIYITLSEGKKMPKILGNETNLLSFSPNFSIFLQKLSVRGSEAIWFLLISNLAKFCSCPRRLP